MDLSTVGALADTDSICGPMQPRAAGVTHQAQRASHRMQMSHRVVSSGALPILAMARCVGSERPDLAWCARDTCAAQAPGSYASDPGYESGPGFDSEAGRGGVTSRPMLVAAVDDMSPASATSLQVCRMSMSHTKSTCAPCRNSPSLSVLLLHLHFTMSRICC